MNKSETLELLMQIKDGSLSPQDALEQLTIEPFASVGDYANIDLHRSIRQGQQEVIYGEGKTKQQILGIARAMIEKGCKNILITRMDPDKADYVGSQIPLYYDEASRIGIAAREEIPLVGNIAVVTAGTSDLPVAKEAYYTARTLGSRVTLISDAGVAGIHRLLHRLPDLFQANVVIAVAGMEGALASAVGGLVSCPVIAVPTSIGYGASFGGLSALLAMLNSCASGVSVVNIDNGFGAGYLADMINQAVAKNRDPADS